MNSRLQALTSKLLQPVAQNLYVRYGQQPASEAMSRARPELPLVLRDMGDLCRSADVGADVGSKDRLVLQAIAISCPERNFTYRIVSALKLPFDTWHGFWERALIHWG